MRTSRRGFIAGALATSVGIGASDIVIVNGIKFHKEELWTNGKEWTRYTFIGFDNSGVGHYLGQHG